MKPYQLINTYELFTGKAKNRKIIRIDIFKQRNGKKFRMRAWIQELYDVYPTLLNINIEKGSPNRIHSSELLNSEITLLIAEKSKWITGGKFKNKENFLGKILKRTHSIFQEI